MNIPPNFNPYKLICKVFISRYHSPPPEYVKPVAHALTYIQNWETMFNEKRSRYTAISKPATTQEQELVADSVRYLGDLLLHLEEFSATDADFAIQFESQINKVAPSELWLDKDLHLPVLHLLADSMTQTLLRLRDDDETQLIGVVAAASLFSFVRYADWIRDHEIGQI
jgi:hypothetical protein